MINKWKYFWCVSFVVSVIGVFVGAYMHHIDSVIIFSFNLIFSYIRVCSINDDVEWHLAEWASKEFQSTNSSAPLTQGELEYNRAMAKLNKKD